MTDKGEWEFDEFDDGSLSIQDLDMFSFVK